MDRHRCIVVPPYRSQLTPQLASGLTAVTWLLAAVLFLPVAFWFREQVVETTEGIEIHVCTLVFPRSESVNLSLCFTIPVLLIACLLPMGLLVFHYQRIFQKLLATRSRWTVPSVGVSATPDCDPPSSCNNHNQPRRDSDLSFVGSLVLPWARKVSTASQVSGTVGANGRAGSLSQHEELRLHKHVRVVRVLLLNVVVVLLMWLPITVVMFLIYVDGSRPNEDTAFFLRSHHFFWALVIALLNTVVNPVLYGVFSENFRACFLRLWFASRRRRKDAAFPPSKSNLDACGIVAEPRPPNRTPSSGRANGYVTAGKFGKKMSACSVGSMLEMPSGQMV